MSFHGILFEKPDARFGKGAPPEPPFFADLNLDQVIDAITAGRQEYDLKPYFYAPLNDVDAIEYRHEVLRDLQEGSLLEQVRSFSARMRQVREHLTQASKLYYRYEKERWFLDAVEIYCEAVLSLMHGLSTAGLCSRGLLAFREHLGSYVESGRFTSLLAEAKKLKGDLSAVRYCLLIKDSTIRVDACEPEVDYTAAVEATFEKFRGGTAKDYRAKFPTSQTGMNHVEAGVLDLVARLNPATFLALDDYCARNADFLDETIAAFDREIQFYVASLEYVAFFERAGLPFCLPRVSREDKSIRIRETFDLALAQKLIREHSSVVPNDFHLSGKERIFVVSGPNQGGKTTFARTFGQLHHLASLGCPVPGQEAQLFLFDQLFTHFEREEDTQNLRGKLHDDLARIHDILSRATASSVVVLNEIFGSTTLRDAVFLGRRMMERVIELDALCVCVTFMDELAALSEKTVSLVSTVDPEDPTVRTYKIVRRPADGLAYALSIAEKYRLTYEALGERLSRLPA